MLLMFKSVIINHCVDKFYIYNDNTPILISNFERLRVTKLSTYYGKYTKYLKKISIVKILFFKSYLRLRPNNIFI